MNLVCDRRYLIALASTLYFVGERTYSLLTSTSYVATSIFTIGTLSTGCAVGGPVFGWMADAFGRRISLVIANVLYTALNVGLVFSRDYISFVAVRFAIGFARQVQYSCNPARKMIRLL